MLTQLLRISLAGAGVVIAAVTAAQAPLSDRSEFEQATAVERVLPQSSVYDILQDKAGFLWFGTREGVARWDGYEVRTWKHDPFNAASLPGNVIRALTEDRFGNVWVLANTYLDLPAGIARLVAPTYETVQRFEGTGHISLDPAGAPLLITDDSVFVYDSTRAAFHSGFVRSPALRELRSFAPRFAWSVSTPDNQLWTLDPLRGIERCDLRARSCSIIDVVDDADISSRRLWVDPRDSTLWLPVGNRVMRWHRGERQVVGSLADDDNALDFSAAADGGVWILSRDGVAHAGPNGIRPAGALRTLARATNPAPIAIETDRAGTVWVGTVWGLYRREHRRRTFGHLEHDPGNSNSLSSGLVVSLAEDSTGNIWVGTIGGGLNMWNRRTGRVVRYRHDPANRNTISHDVVWRLAVDASNTIWAGGSSGLNRIDASRRVRRFIRDPSIPSTDAPGSGNTITDLSVGANGVIWLACGAFCGDSLFFFDTQRETFSGIHLSGVRHAGYFHLIAPDTAWVGSQNGLHLVNLRTGAAAGVVDSAGGNLDGVLAFQPTEHGMWVGANSGLYRYSLSGHLEARYTGADGLPSNAVFGVLEDTLRRVWVSTNRGLALIASADNGGQVLRQFDDSDGVGNVEFNRNAYLEGRDGTFYFGGDRGLTYFRPDDFSPNDFQPPVVLTGVTRSTRAGATTTVPAPSTEIRIAPSDYTFSISFAALNYIDPHRNRYRVMLEGFDDVWKEHGTARTATYTNVPPGTYRFMVRGSNDDGLWSETPAIATVVVEPHLVETLWFRTGLVLFAASLIALATWYVSRSRYQLALQRSMAEQRLGVERARISRDMHDEVGASLTEISILSELAGTTGSSDLLQRIGAKSRTTIDSIGDIIWAIDPRNDEGDRFVAYLRQHASDFLESTGIRGELTFPLPGATPLVSAERRRTVLLVLKEALANAAKHGSPTVVQVSLAVLSSSLHLSVIDNGCGFSTDESPNAGTGVVGRHNGLANMTARAAALGGQCDVVSRPGAGTTVRFSIPLDGRGSA